MTLRIDLKKATCYEVQTAESPASNKSETRERALATTRAYCCSL